MISRFGLDGLDLADTAAISLTYLDALFDRVQRPELPELEKLAKRFLALREIFKDHATGCGKIRMNILSVYPRS